MHLSRSIITGLALWWSLILAVSAGAAAPLQVGWSDKTYGPDGPWYAVTAHVGQPEMQVDLFPAGVYKSYLISSNYCQNTTLDTTCYAETGGLYNSTASQSAYTGIQYTDGVFTSIPLPMSGVAEVIMDTMHLTAVGTASVDIMIPVAGIDAIQWAYNTYPNGKHYPITLGTLCLGAPETNWTFGDAPTDNGGTTTLNASVVPNYLYETQITQSAAYGLHIGSVSAGIAPSLFFGGYDQSRVLGAVATQPYVFQAALRIDLLDIGFGVATGASPLPYASKAGLLAQGNSSIVDSISVLVEPGTPYMFLPRSTCDAMTRDLPIQYNNDLGLYFWNMSDASYSKIVSSPSFYNFTFRNTNGPPVSINVPFSLLNLTLTAPLVTQPQAYFPCYPETGNNYTLGRAFLQSAFVAVNWEPNSPPGNWWLAQAPGPNTARNAVAMSIMNTDHQIQSSTTDWASTWKGFWTPLKSDPNVPNATVPVTSDETRTGELSTGAKAGIGIGAVFGVLLVLGISGFLLWRRRSRRADSKHGEKEATAAGYRPDSKAMPKTPLLQEANAYKDPVEMPIDRAAPAYQPRLYPRRFEADDGAVSLQAGPNVYELSGSIRPSP